MSETTGAGSSSSSSLVVLELVALPVGVVRGPADVVELVVGLALVELILQLVVQRRRIVVGAAGRVLAADVALDDRRRHVHLTEHQHVRRRGHRHRRGVGQVERRQLLVGLVRGLRLQVAR